LKKPSQKIKVFIDTDVLIAGVASVTGASAAVLDLSEAEILQMVISRQVLVEADRNFSSKLPNLAIQFRQFIRDLAPLMVEDPPAKAVERAAGLIDRKDAAILAAAIESEVDYLITLDKKHFLTPKVRQNILIEVCTPADFLRIFERLWFQD
jgi:putative PIN family toxin of toxin-antitoxin system